MRSILWLKFTRMKYEYYMYVIMMLMAIVLSFIFGNSFAGEGTQRIAVADNDSSQATNAFIEAVKESVYSITLTDEAEAQSSVSKGDALAALVIPEGFGEALKTGGARITLIQSADSADIMAFQTAVRSAASKTAHVYALQRILSDTLAATDIGAPSFEDVSGGYENRMGGNSAVQVDFVMPGAGGNQERFVTNVHYFMGLNVFFVTFSIVFTIGSILEDKKLRTWDRIRISPISATSVLAGNFIPAFIVGALQMCIVLVLGQLMFGMDFGDRLPPILLVFGVYVLTMTCFGLLLSALFNTYEQLNAGTPVILVATAMLGGCMWPLSIVGSDVLLGIANAVPQKWAVEAAEGLAAGGSLGGAVTSILVLLGMAAVFFTASVALYNKKQRA